jgi:hypothetical protein
MKTKVAELFNTLRLKADELGLKFVDGPDNTAKHLEKPSYGPVNGVERAVGLFAVTLK